jgi:uncharacterized protein (TIGR03435 family)
MLQPLISHLWQSTFFAVAAGLLTLAFRKNRAQIRYWLWFSASLKFLLPFALLIGVGSALETLLPPVPQNAPATPVIAWTTEQFGHSLIPDPVPTAAPAAPTDWIPFAVLAIWLSGFATISLLRFRGWLRVRNAIRSSSPVGIPAAVPVRVSGGLIEPGVVGVWRPVLLLPEGIVERLSPSELQTVLAHELCHVRRRDNLFAAIHMAVEALFWFHPLVWWIGARLLAERERACDEEVLRLGNQPDVYADAILNVCKLYTESPLACVSGVSGSDIKRRIEAIMSNQRMRSLNRARRLLLAAAGTAVLAGPVAIGLLVGIGRAQPAQTPRPKFDAASIRPCQATDSGGRGGGKAGANPGFNPNMPEGVGGYFGRSPGRLDVTCASVLTMINVAYVEHDSPLLNNPAMPTGSGDVIKGLPQWTLSARYTIHAETEDPAANGPTTGFQDTSTRLLFGVMLQTLLEDRFQLKLHRVTEQSPMYALTVAKGGLKMKPLKDGDCTPLEQGRGMKRIGANDKPYCGWVGWPINGPNRTLVGGGISMERLAHELGALILDKNVIDRTGLAGDYILRLEYAPDEKTRCFGPPAMCAVDPGSDIPPAANIFTAMEQQLGLKLEPIKGPKEHIVIDHVERPSEN